MLPKRVHEHQPFVPFMLIRLFDNHIATTSHVLETNEAYYSKYCF